MATRTRKKGNPRLGYCSRKCSGMSKEQRRKCLSRCLTGYD